MTGAAHKEVKHGPRMLALFNIHSSVMLYAPPQLMRHCFTGGTSSVIHNTRWFTLGQPALTDVLSRNITWELR